MINAFDDVKFEAASVLAELYEQQKQISLSKPILRKAIELSQHTVYWHCRLIFQLAVSLRFKNVFYGSQFYIFVANTCQREGLSVGQQFVRGWG